MEAQLRIYLFLWISAWDLWDLQGCMSNSHPHPWRFLAPSAFLILWPSENLAMHNINNADVWTCRATRSNSALPYPFPWCSFKTPKMLRCQAFKLQPGPTELERLLKVGMNFQSVSNLSDSRMSCITYYFLPPIAEGWWDILHELVPSTRFSDFLTNNQESITFICCWRSCLYVVKPSFPGGHQSATPTISEALGPTEITSTWPSCKAARTFILSCEAANRSRSPPSKTSVKGSSAFLIPVG